VLVAEFDESLPASRRRTATAMMALANQLVSVEPGSAVRRAMAQSVWIAP
jgi:hypothetical protein